jgi:hypothetical protein
MSLNITEKDISSVLGKYAYRNYQYADILK